MKCFAFLGFAALSLLFSPVLEAFTIISNNGFPARWSSGDIEYEFHNVPGEFYSAIDSAFSVWTAVGGVDLSVTRTGIRTSNPDSRDRINTVSWVESGWRDLSFRPPSNALAVTLSSFSSRTGIVVDADIYFNAQYFDWKVVDPENPDDRDFVDVQNIATHEVGHLLGLDHASEDWFETNNDLYEATMYYASGAGETFRRDPASDDIHGIRSLYPEAASAPARLSSISLVETVGSIAIYDVTGQNFGAQTSFVVSTGDSSELDRVARYKTIRSSTEAQIEIDLRNFNPSSALLVAMNDTNSISSLEFSISSGATSGSSSSSSSSELSSSGGGGGGCAANANSASNVLILFALFASLMGAAFSPLFRRQAA